MKIEIGESLGYSFLRHVKGCWLVQVNWKASEHWPKRVNDAELQAMFEAMKRRFDPDGGVFKKTKDAAQFLRQGEIDVLGVTQRGVVHAIEAAFHEGGLNYGGGVANRVLKKVLRTMMILTAYQSPEAKIHIYFVSPKVNNSDRGPLEDTFATLRTEYPDIEWNLIINQGFADQIVNPTLEKAGTVSDTSELFMRSVKLLDLSLGGSEQANNARPDREAGGTQPSVPEKIQPLVRELMKTLLESHATFLDEVDRHNLMDREYCKKTLGLQIGNFALIRRAEAGQEISGYSRYWNDLYAAEFYVCSQWARGYHVRNAESLLRFVSGLIRKNQDHLEVSALERHEEELGNYIRRARRREWASTCGADDLAVGG